MSSNIRLHMDLLQRGETYKVMTVHLSLQFKSLDPGFYLLNLGLTPNLNFIILRITSQELDLMCHMIDSCQLGLPIGIPLCGIARNDYFRLSHFIALNGVIVANNEAIKYLQNCMQQNCFAKAFPSKNFELHGIVRNCV